MPKIEKIAKIPFVVTQCYRKQKSRDHPPFVLDPVETDGWIFASRDFCLILYPILGHIPI